MTRHNIARLFERRRGHLDYRIKRDYVRNGIAVIPKSKDLRHMRENLDVFDYTLSEREMQIIRAMNQRRSYCNWPASMREEA